MCITPESLALERSGRTVPFHNFIVEYKKNSNKEKMLIERIVKCLKVLQVFLKN